MMEDKFSVYIDSVLAAENMTLETAMVLVQGLFNKYYLEPSMKITIQKVQINDDQK